MTTTKKKRQTKERFAWMDERAYAWVAGKVIDSAVCDLESPDLDKKKLAEGFLFSPQEEILLTFWLSFMGCLDVEQWRADFREWQQREVRRKQAADLLGVSQHHEPEDIRAAFKRIEAQCNGNRDALKPAVAARDLLLRWLGTNWAAL